MNGQELRLALQQAKEFHQERTRQGSYSSGKKYNYPEFSGPRSYTLKKFLKDRQKDSEEEVCNLHLLALAFWLMDIKSVRPEGLSHDDYFFCITMLYNLETYDVQPFLQILFRIGKLYPEFIKSFPELKILLKAGHFLYEMGILQREINNP